MNQFTIQLPSNCCCKCTFLQTNEAFYRNIMLHQLSFM